MVGRSPGDDTLSVVATSPAHPYDSLTPELILEAVETFGGRCTGALLALNSYENRVYRVDLEDAEPVVAKFYRPGRWSDATILEEHAFALELAAHEIPAVAPLARAADGRTLCDDGGFRFALFPWARGRAPELNTADDRRLLGRYLGRLHRLGAAGRFRHRPRLSVEELGRKSVATLTASAFVPEELRAPYFRLTELLLPALDAVFAQTADAAIRLHGDFHLGNVLWGAHGPIIVDLDDCVSGPAIQDLWMLLSGPREEMERLLAEYLEGYSEFMEFEPAELRLIEPLRTLRLLRYSAWLAARWDDPAFPPSFPWFATRRYWEDQILLLRQQLAALDEPPLAWRA